MRFYSFHFLTTELSSSKFILLFTRSVVSDSLRPHRLQHTRLPCPSPSPGVHSNSCPLSWWCYPTISVQFSPSVMSNSFWPHRLQHTRPPCPSPTPGACSNSCPSSWWCHPTNDRGCSAVPFSSCPQSFPASGSLPMTLAHRNLIKIYIMKLKVTR